MKLKGVIGDALHHRTPAGHGPDKWRAIRAAARHFAWPAVDFLLSADHVWRSGPSRWACSTLCPLGRPEYRARPRAPHHGHVPFVGRKTTESARGGRSPTSRRLTGSSRSSRAKSSTARTPRKAGASCREASAQLEEQLILPPERPGAGGLMSLARRACAGEDALPPSRAIPQ